MQGQGAEGGHWRWRCGAKFQPEAASCCSSLQAGSSPQTPQSQVSVSALKNSLEENLRGDTFRGHWL